MDLYSPAVLNRVIDDLRDDPAVGTFLIRRYFGEISQSTEEAVYFDVLTGKPRLAPFVSPLVEGQIVQSQGYKTNSFTPAYVKDKRRNRPKCLASLTKAASGRLFRAARLRPLSP